jgi:hypothetical protein
VADPRRYVVVSGRFTWTQPFGEGTRIDAGEVGMDVDSRGAGLEDVRASIARFDVKTPKSVLGPWRFAYERSSESARARVLFDPPLMDGPNAMIVWNRTGSAQLVVRVLRTPLAHLGVRPGELGLPADASTELEVNVEGEQAASGRVDAKAQASLFAARVNGMRGPVDIHAESTASGVADKPLDLDKTKVTVGPFVALVDGTLELHSRGFRADATWRTQPIPCSTLARAEATKMGPLAEALQDLAHATGALRVTGNAHAAGLLRYDTRAPGTVAVTFTTRDTCGVSLFGL